MGQGKRIVTMEIEFICLHKLGAGPTIVRFSEIYAMEFTPLGYTRIEHSFGYMIVEETPNQILQKIREAKLLNEKLSNDSKKDAS